MYNVFIIITILILIHELGHFLFAKIFKAKLDKIIIYPLGGISKFKLSLNISIKKELIIVLAGPIFQFFAYYLLLLIWPRYEHIIKVYHYSILVFNLLPIYPLDGGKIINLLFSINLSYKQSFKLTIIISYITILLLIVINYKNIYLNLVIMIIFLVYKLISEQKKLNYLYNKLLLERYMNKLKFKKKIIIKNGNNFHRNKQHLINDNGSYYLESEYLEKKYKKT